ncbi:Tetratricopeptide repeat-containing protein [Tistlia consotensis]|uniref:Tetratricopeptide repeat-containing protein n=1 Tax=Tistlia consotensis USBA 355 TaxID=560819 RepID=A0A1Y6BQ46_9PROT|nr:tetratricopeptide repeat protein [Tistlia consotensis]SMF14628.1 Tetratricopeptide repeat-containing protein [Tistlia consotensis USBA 355]SNR49403.1 Tetratricopeptide repeat-containing protein [Tistlia consotensis]
MRFLWIAAALAVTASCLPGAGGRSWAQSAPAAAAAPAATPGASPSAEQLERQSRDAIDALERLERSRPAPGDADGPVVTWAQVLRDPDNLQLNLAFARRQLALGELKGASATLERVLLIAPDQPEVQLLHGLVLYRLREYAGAEQALRAALAGGISGRGKDEAERALDAIADSRRRTLGTLSVAAGVRYDTNRDQAPITGKRLFLDFPIAADPGQPDSAIVTIARLRLVHRLTGQAGHELFAEGTYYGANQLEIDDLDLRFFSAGAGMALHFGPFTVTPRGHADLLQLAGQNYLTSLGSEAQLSWQALRGLVPFLEASIDDENFDDVHAAPSGEDRTGPLWRLAAGFRWQVAPDVAFELSGARATKNAREQYEGYQTLELTAAPTFLLGGGQFLRGELTVRRRRYFGPDRFVSEQTRRDVDWVARLTYGAPLSLYARPLPGLAAALEGLQLLISLEQQRTVSNIPNYDYLSHRGQILLTRSFRF